MTLSGTLLREKALELGFNLVGITAARPSPTLAAYRRWIDQGMHGSMAWLARPDRRARRRDLNVILPGVQTLLVVGLDYAQSTGLEQLLNDRTRGRIAAYAWGLDYHDVMSERLEQMATWLHAESGRRSSDRVYVDTGAILERSHAQQAGLGFFGKNTMLIHPRRGSHFFIGEILTSLEIDDHDRPQQGIGCGTCTRCLDVCPTDAFPRPFVLDARLCISYLTIEHKGWIDRDLRPLTGNWIFGCDLCQDVCPFQRFSVPTREAALLQADPDRIAPSLTSVLDMDADEFLRRWRGTPLQRTGHELLLRNACLAATNGAVSAAVPALTRLLDAASPLLRGHAAWALARLDETAARPALRSRLTRERDPEVREELDLALAGA
ncbi:MAG: tRNA epoxyqueuosine(34) reductase QueG [Anaerolineaceae bacterium]|nr:tRNA epoxyqueuosine(34) reductase QueG [Anaerolineaceae bacterium]